MYVVVVVVAFYLAEVLKYGYGIEVSRGRT